MYISEKSVDCNPPPPPPPRKKPKKTNTSYTIATMPHKLEYFFLSVISM